MFYSSIDKVMKHFKFIVIALFAALVVTSCGSREIKVENRAVVTIAPLKPLVETILGEDFYLYRWDNGSDKSVAHGGLTVTPSEQVLGAMMCQWECNYEEEHDWIVENLPPFADRTWNVGGYYARDAFPGEKLTEMQKKVY